MNNSDHFRRLYDLGYRALVPIIPPGAPISERSNLHKRLAAGQDDRGKVPGIRWPDGKWSGFDWLPYEADERDLARWQAMGAGVGIKTGIDGVVLIDADTLSKEHAYVIKETVDRIIGPCPIRIGRSPKAGYVARVSEPVPYQRIEFGDERVEILSAGRQFVAEGTHPTGAAYRWPVPLSSIDDLPVVTPDQITALLEALRAKLPAATPIKREGAQTTVSQASLKGDPALVKKAVASIPNTSAHFPAREDYRNLGYAIKAALPDDPDAALSLFQDWCARWTDGDNDPGIVEADFKRMKPPYRRGAAWLYELAEQHSGGAFSAAERWFSPIDEAPLFAENLPKPKKKLTLVSLAEAAALALSDPTEPLVEDLIDQGTMSVVYGKSNSGKTFVVMDMCEAIATGRAWGALETTQAGVVYVAAEGGRGVRKRAAALLRRSKDYDVPFNLIMSPVDLFRAESGDVEALIEAINEASRALENRPKPKKVGIVVLDTLSRILAGGDENASTDMGRLVKNLDAIRQATAVHLMVVHHTGKNQALGARGWSGLQGAIDTEIEIAPGEIAVTKQRDGDKEWSSAFELDPVVLGLNARDKPITSCTVRLVARKDAATGEASAGELEVLQALRDLLSLADEPARGISTAEVVAHMIESDKETTKEGVRHHLRRLSAKRLIATAARGKWTTCPEKSGQNGLATSIRPIDDSDANGQIGQEVAKSIFT